MNPVIRLFRRVRRLLWKSRSLGLLSETLFWWQWVRTGGDQWPEDFDQRLNPRKPLIKAVATYVSRISSDPIRILDVGAGPLTVLGYCLDGRNVEITAVDVLAKVYNRLLSIHGFVPPVPTIYADGECLDKIVRSDYFDFVYAQNSIDHSVRPHLVIEQMIKAAKPGCYILIRTHENEAASGDYGGLHPWNFTEKNGDFIIWNDRETSNMTELLIPRAIVRTERHENFILIEIRKNDRPSEMGSIQQYYCDATQGDAD